jgi:hypothetical protein
VQWPRRLQKLIVRASELEVLAKEVTAIIKAQIRYRFEGMARQIYFSPLRALSTAPVNFMGRHDPYW